MAVNVVGLVVVLVFYAAIVLVGILAARFVKPGSGDGGATEMAMVAGRNLGLFVGIFTMSATTVGGAYLAGTTEYIAVSGLVWTVYPFTILLALIIGSFVFAKPMRERNYLTLLDPLQEKFGDVMTGFLLVGALLAEVLWGASILIALGASLSVILNVDVGPSIVASSLVALLYTMFGQMVSVAYTDVLQFAFVVVGMVLCVPFAMSNSLVGDMGKTSHVWLGTLPRKQAASWLDYVISQMLGGIPWNTYIMRILSARSVRHAQVISIAGGIIGWSLAVPPFLLGVVAVSTDWNETALGYDPVAAGEEASLMPYVIQNLTPEPVALIGLSALVAAVMSSMDSIILSSSSMFAHNIYKMALRPVVESCVSLPPIKDLELRLVQAAAMCTVALASTTLALTLDTIAGLFILSADVVYVVLFPQLVCAIFVPWADALGSFLALLTGLLLRFGGGEPSLGLKAFIRYPYYDDSLGQLFPYKTLAMLGSAAVLVAVSWLRKALRGGRGELITDLHQEGHRSTKALTPEDEGLDVGDYLPLEQHGRADVLAMEMVKY